MFKFQLFALALFGLLNQSAMAITLDPPTTAHGSPINFCDTNAQAAMKELDQLTLLKVGDINKIKSDINHLKANKNLIDGFIKVRNDYKKSFTSLAQDAADKKLSVSSKLTQFKQLLRTSLTLSMVNLIAKSEKNSSQRKDIDELCKQKENTSNFCRYINSKIIPSGLSPEISNLNKTLENVYMALDKSKNEEQIKADLANIYDTIPSPIEPETILGDLLSKSPHLSQTLTQTKNQNLITSCLSNIKTDSECQKLMNNVESHEDLKNLLTKEMTDVQKTFSEKKFNDFFENLNPSSSTISNSKPKNEKLNALTGELASEFEKNGQLSIPRTKLLFDQFKKNCSQTSDVPINLKECEETSDKIITLFENDNAKKETQLNADIEKLNLAIKNDGALHNLEKFKQYVAEKHLRKCSQNKETSLASNLISPCLSDPGSPGDSGAIRDLESKLAGVIGNLATKNTATSQRGELGIFSKQELSIYQNYCDNTKLKSTDVVASICRDITIERNQIMGQKESSEWDKFNEDYIVQYSPINPKGYDVYQKRSNFSIIGRSFLESANRIVPMWTMNEQYKYQIDYMTNQALYQKQMMYMNSPDSPWLSMPYFGGYYYNTFGTGNMTNTGFNFGAGATINAGFNFTN
jgi:hypothetical protein